MKDIRNTLIKEINHTDTCTWDLEDIIYDLLHGISISTLRYYCEDEGSVEEMISEVIQNICKEELSVDELREFAIHLMDELSDEDLIANLDLVRI